MSEAIMIVDQYQRFRDGLKKGYRVDVKNEARQLHRLLLPLGTSYKRRAIVDEEDREGKQAFMEADFITTTMNGSRSRELSQLITDEIHNIRRDKPGQLVIVSADTSFGPLCASVDRQKTNLLVWSPTGEIPSEFARYNTMQLDELVETRIEIEKWHVFIDYENIHIGLKKRGFNPRPQNIINAIKAAVGDGQIVKSVAFADWQKLGGDKNINFQSDLYDLDVNPQYQKNIAGKNTADMEIARHIYRDLSLEPNVDVIAIVSGDRDFRPVLKEIKGKKRAVILALKDSISRDVEVAADDIIYLDNYLKLTQIKRPHNAQRNPLSAPTIDQDFTLTLSLAWWLWQQRWSWVYRDRLVRRIDEVGPFKEEDIAKALEKEILIDGERPNSVMLNPDHPAGRTARHLCWWAPRRIRYGLETRGFEYVDTRFMVQGMSGEPTFQALKVGRSRSQVEKILNTAAEVGVLVKRRQPHFKIPDRMLDTWWIPGHEPPEESDVSVATDPANDPSSPTEAVIVEEPPEPDGSDQDPPEKPPEILTPRVEQPGKEAKPKRKLPNWA